jgi:hypothetical protein
MKTIEMVFPKRNIRIPATLLEDEAPKTCEAVWSVLTESDDPESIRGWPEKGEVHTGQFVGPELYVFLPPDRKNLPIENLTFRPIPGDVMLFVIPDDYRRRVIAGLWDFSVFYDRGGDLRVEPPGVEGVGWRGSRFAKVPNIHLDELLDLGNKIWREGVETMIVRRLV